MCVCECVCVCDYVYVSKSLCVCECVNECSCQLHSTNLVVLRQCYHVFTVDQQLLSSCVFPEVSTMASYTSVQSKSNQAEMILSNNPVYVRVACVLRRVHTKNRIRIMINNYY